MLILFNLNTFLTFFNTNYLHIPNIITNFANDMEYKFINNKT